MNKNKLKLFGWLFTVFLGIGFVFSPAQAQGVLSLQVLEDCNLSYAGNSCEGILELENNTEEKMLGTAFLHINYQGVCSNNEPRNFDGVGIDPRFYMNGNWQDFSAWQEGTTTVSGLEINPGESEIRIKLDTHVALCPGDYDLTVTVKANYEGEEEEEDQNEGEDFTASTGGVSFYTNYPEDSGDQEDSEEEPEEETEDESSDEGEVKGEKITRPEEDAGSGTPEESGSGKDTSLGEKTEKNDSQTKKTARGSGFVTDVKGEKIKSTGTPEKNLEEESEAFQAGEGEIDKKETSPKEVSGIFSRILDNLGLLLGILALLILLLIIFFIYRKDTEKKNNKK